MPGAHSIALLLCLIRGSDGVEAAQPSLLGVPQSLDAPIGSRFLNISTQARLFSDAHVRISAREGMCPTDRIPGAVTVLPQGVEIHTGGGRNWHWSDQALNCSATGGPPYQGRCLYWNAEGGVFRCLAAGGALPPQSLNCACEQCPCPSGRGGFGCSSCTDNRGCPAGTSCSKSVAVPRNQARAYTCTFAQDSGHTYSTFWPSGWSHPQALFQWDPAGDTLTLDIIQNMCSRSQPILLQCSCSHCKYYEDSMDHITQQLDGPCMNKGLPSPCGSCNTCRCGYPENSHLADMVRGLINSVHAGLAFGCKDGRCTGILEDLPIHLVFACETGLCTEDVDTQIHNKASLGWVTVALGILSLVCGGASIVVVHSLAARSSQRTLATKAPAVPPDPPAKAEQTLTLCWEVVRCLRGAREVLIGASGAVVVPGGSGRLVAVTGPSGCGKTTLLEMLAGRNIQGDIGSVTINGVVMQPRQLRRHIGYVPQQDVLSATLTVRETLEFSAAMRLGALSAQQRAGRVNWALSQLQLERVASSRIGDMSNRGLSGGEKRRVAVAVELLVLPSVLVLDEATTGLDAASALCLGRLLRSLATQGRLLLCSLHQPRPELVAVFHETIELPSGGLRLPAASVLPPGAAILDAVVPIAKEPPNVPSTSAVGPLLLGSCHVRRPGSPKARVDQEELELGPALRSVSGVAISAAPCPEHGPVPPCRSSVPRPVLLGRCCEVQEVGALKAEEAADPWGVSWRCRTRCPNTNLQEIVAIRWPCQLMVLWRRSMVEASRGSLQGWWSAAVALGVGVFCGLVFRNLDDGVTGVQNRFGSIFFVQLFFGFCGLEVCSLWHVDRPRADHERAANFYHGSAYFVSKAAAYLFWYCLVLPGLFVVSAYPLMGYAPAGNVAKPLFYFLCVCGTAAASSGICLFITSLTQSLAAGVSTSAILLTLLLMFCGFLRPRSALPQAFQLMLTVSPFSHSFAAMIANEMQGLATHFDASGYDPVDLTGDIWLYQFDIDPAQIPEHVWALAYIALASWVLACVPVLGQWYRSPLTRHLECCLPPLRTDLATESALQGVEIGSNSSRGASDDLNHTLAWRDLSLKLPCGRVLLDGVTASAASARPFAVLGPSGCGKSSLLGRLAGEVAPQRRSAAHAAQELVAIDGVALSPEQLCRAVGYVQQEDALHAALTVREVLSFAAALRLPHAGAAARCARVGELLQRLGLEAVANSCLGGKRSRGVSGGERRRAAVGVELVASRQVLILDEPTSGLDLAASLAMGRLLAELAADGCVVVASLQQPRPELLAHFADLLVLAPGGKVAYGGPTEMLAEYLKVLYGPQAIDSPADRILDAVSNNESSLVNAFTGSAPEARLLQLAAERAEPRPCERFATTPTAALLVQPTPPIWTQLRQLVVREARVSLREHGLAAWHYGSALCAGLMLGFSYHSLPLNLVGVISRIGLFFAVQCLLSMQALQSLMAWREGHAGFLREHAAGCYSIGAFVLAKVSVDGILLRCGPTVLLGGVLYPLAGLHPGREGVCLIGLCMASMASSAFCLALGAVAPRSAATLPLAVLLLLVFLLLGGVMLRDASPWLASTSFFRASYHLLVSNEFRGLEFAFRPAGINRDFTPLSGEEWLRLLKIDAAPEVQHIFVLLLFCTCFTIFAWLALATTKHFSKVLTILVNRSRNWSIF